MTWVADTSWLYAYFAADDSHHKVAAEEARLPEPIEVPPVVLTELLYLVGKRGGKEAAINVLADLQAMPHMPLQSEMDLDATFTIWREHAVSLPDANAIAWAHKRRAKLRTFDDRQKKVLTKLK